MTSDGGKQEMRRKAEQYLGRAEELKEMIKAKEGEGDVYIRRGGGASDTMLYA